MGSDRRRLEEDTKEILALYREAKKNGKYEPSLLYTGKMASHYGMKNQMEYFAESSESYVGVNDFYPFVRADKQHDPKMFEVMKRIWGKPIEVINSRLTVPAGTAAGHRITHGTRIPPSRMRPLPPESGRFSPRPIAPLSELKITRVLSSIPSSFRARRISPTDQSSSWIASL
jgi:hypothetical protein